LNKFLIFTDNRTGSSSLFKVLSAAYCRKYKDSNATFCGTNEPFHPKVIEHFYGKEYFDLIFETKPNYSADPKTWKNRGEIILNDFDYKKKVFDNSFKHSYGVKHIWGHLKKEDNTKIINIAVERGYKIIYLTRENWVKKCFSHLVCEHFNQWQKTPKIKEPVVLDLDRLKFLIEKYLEEIRYYNSLFKEIDKFSVTYEQLFVDKFYWQKCNLIGEILNFCGINCHWSDTASFPDKMFNQVMIKKKKYSSKKLYDNVINMQEIDEFCKSNYKRSIF